MPDFSSLPALQELLTEKKECLRLAIAMESDKRNDGATAEERTIRLKRALSFGFIGKTGDEPRSLWMKLTLEEAENPSQGSGVYVLIDGDWKTGETCAYARYRDPRDRDPERERTPADALNTNINFTLEQSRISEARACEKAEKAEARAEQLSRQLREKEDELRLEKDRTAQLQREAGDGGAIGLILTTALPYVDQAITLFREHGEAEKARHEADAAKRKKADENAKKAQLALSLLGELAEAIQNAPGASKVIRDRNVRAVVQRATEAFQDDADEADDDQGETIDAKAEPVNEGDPAPEEAEET